jgi:hypothetical protein
VRVDAVDLVDDGHGRERGVVGADEQVPRWIGILAGQDAFTRERDERMSYLERRYSDTGGLGRHSRGSSR